MKYLSDNVEKIHDNLLKLSRRFESSVSNEDDFYQAGYLAIMESEKHYDPNRSASFVTYATGVAINAMRKILLQEQSITTMSESTQSFINKLTKAKRNGTLETTKEKLNISDSRAELLLSLPSHNKTNQKEQLSYIGIEERSNIKEYINYDDLQDQEKLILEEYLKNKKLSEIANDNNIEYQGVIKIFNKLIDKLKRQNRVNNES